MSLKLVAVDTDDLEVVSAALQDSIAKVGDIAFEPKARRMTMTCNRFRWEQPNQSQRVLSALQVGGVLGVRSRGFTPQQDEALLQILHISFEPKDAPGGVLTFTLAEGADLALEVECLDLVLADVSDPWPARRKPEHGIN